MAGFGVLLSHKSTLSVHIGIQETTLADTQVYHRRDLGGFQTRIQVCVSA